MLTFTPSPSGRCKATGETPRSPGNSSLRASLLPELPQRGRHKDYISHSARRPERALTSRRLPDSPARARAHAPQYLARQEGGAVLVVGGACAPGANSNRTCKSQVSNYKLLVPATPKESPINRNSRSDCRYHVPYGQMM